MDETSAQTITDVYPFHGKYAINVDFERKEYQVCWSGSWQQPPNLSQFPSSAETAGATVTPIPHSPAVVAVWSCSRAIRHGANAHIRLLDNNPDHFPICKVAINEKQRQMIADELYLLRYLATKGSQARIVQTLPEPLQDQDGIFGFRMRKLKPITCGEVAEYYHEILEVVHLLHSAGVVHFDLSWTNIMLDDNGRITLIDFSHAGFTEENIPPHKQMKITRPSYVKYLACHDLELLQDLLRKSEKE